MSRARKRHTRRLRRQMRAHLCKGASMPRHKLKAGRTGMVQKKRLSSLLKNKRWVKSSRETDSNAE